MTIEDLLREESRILREFSNSPERFPTMQDFVLHNGRPYVWQPRPMRYRAGRFKLCFANSYRLAKRHGLIYVEGFAKLPGIEYLTLHAWCVEPGDDKVIDVTSQLFDEYFGVGFTLEAVERHWAEYESTSLIDNWEAGYPLLNATDEQLAKMLHRTA